MNAEEHVTIEELNHNIQNLSTKIEQLEYEVTNDQIKINSHPVMFIVLLIGFFITMDFWAVAAHTTVRKFHPKGHLRYWEYIILAALALLLLLWVANKSGIKIQTLREG